MITNETRAKLIGKTAKMYADDTLSFWCADVTHAHGGYWSGKPPAYDTDANAVAELRAFVRARGKMREFCGHILQIVAPTLNIGAFPIERIVDLLDATPAQQTKAFDTVFADDLEKL